MFETLISFFPDSFKKLVRKKIYGTEMFKMHYSQCGEDITAATVIHHFLKVNKGFFVDVGSFHPHKSSNTFLLYKKGWRGINIDPRPGSKKLFDKERPHDINLEIGIGAKNETLKYYFLNDKSTYNSFSVDCLQKNEVFDQVTKVFDCEVLPLSEVLEKYMPPDKEIDYLNVDTEGFELEVLKSFDILKWQPKIIALEQNYICTLQDVMNSESCKFLEKYNYQPVAKNIIKQDVSTITYIHSRFISPDSLGEV